jgi:DNA-binding NarL/FixJ family response regulator
MKTNANRPLHVLVAEPLPLVREGLLAMLEHITSVHIHPVSVNNRQSLDSLLAVRQIDLLLVSSHFDGAFDFQQFRQQHPQIPCAAIVTDLVTLAKTDKSLPYLTITTSSDQLALLIEQLVREKSATPASPADERDVLSVREREILVLLAQGLSNKEIADRLFLSVYTVMTHRRNICQKLNIHSVSGLTIYAIANKLMEL